VAHDVADDQRDPLGGEGDEVVPVAADLRAEPGGQVVGGGGDGGHGRQQVGEERALELAGAAGGGVVQPRPLQRLRDQAAERGEQRALLAAEAVGAGVGEDADADGPAGGDEGKVDAGVLLLRQGIVPHPREAGEEVLGRFEELRDAGAQRLAHRGVLRVRRSGDLVEEAGAVAAGTDGMEAPLLHRQDDEPVGAEGGYQAAGDGGDHVVGGEGLGEGPREPFDEGDPGGDGLQGGQAPGPVRREGIRPIQRSPSAFTAH
jgi:hypothetical protein